MKVAFVLLFLVILIGVGATLAKFGESQMRNLAKYLRTLAESKDSMREIFKDMIFKSRIRAFTLTSRKCSAKSRICKVHNQVIRTIEAIVPTFHLNLACNKRTLEHIAGRIINWKHCNCRHNKKSGTALLFDSDNVVHAPMLFLPDYQNDFKISRIGYNYNFLKLIQSLSKFLIIAIVDKSHSLNNKKLLATFHRGGLLDIQILQITVKPNFTLNYHLFHFNAYTRKFSVQRYSPRITWFRDITRNMQQHKLTLCFSKSSNYLRADIVDTPAHWMVNLELVSAIERIINMTTRRIEINTVKVLNCKRCNIGFWWVDQTECACSIMNRIKRPTITIMHLLTPVLYETTTEYNIVTFAFSLLSIISVVVTIKLSTWLLRLDQQQWCPVIIFGMIVSIANPRNFSLPVDCAMLILLFATSFFFGSDLVSGLTTNILVKDVEKSITEINDLQLYNLTVVLPTFYYENRHRKDANDFSDVLHSSKIIYNDNP